MSGAARIARSRWLRAAGTIVLVAYAALSFDLAAAADRLAGIDPALAAAGVLLLLAGQLVCALRWRELGLRVLEPAPARWYAAVYLRGCLYNSVLPTGLGGDAVKVAAARRLGRAVTAARTVITDRVSGLLALALLAGLVLPAAGYGLPSAIAWAVAGACALLIAAASVWAVRAALTRWLAYTAGYELIWIAGVWALAAALAVDAGPAALTVAVLVVGVVTALPISIGGHGARESAFVLILAPLGVGAPAAVALGVAFGAALLLVGLTGALVRVPALAPPAPARGHHADRPPAPGLVAAGPLPTAAAPGDAA